jgi:hypothetical protein
VKNDYSIIGMLSRGIIPLPLLGGVGCSLHKRTPPCLRFAQTSLPTRARERKAFAGMTMRVSGEGSVRGDPSSGSMLKTHLATFSRSCQE